jgi:C-terminal processing protease CtpA/Prc
MRSGQKYFGPVILIIDALCYSTTDMFAAGFQDHNIGEVLGADGIPEQVVGTFGTTTTC